MNQRENIRKNNFHACGFFPNAQIKLNASYELKERKTGKSYDIEARVREMDVLCMQ